LAFLLQLGAVKAIVEESPRYRIPVLSGTHEDNRVTLRDAGRDEKPDAYHEAGFVVIGEDEVAARMWIPQQRGSFFSHRLLL
ncbi:MAG: hypothetical protein ABJC89_24505, partial [Acidobacteriota bacterium]